MNTACDTPVRGVPVALHNEEHDPSSYAAIIKLALPMILSTTGSTIMIFLDGIFLARYSENAIAAVGPGGMASWLFMSFLNGTAGYTSTFVAQYKGSGQGNRIGAIVWQGIYFALCSALILAVFGSLFAHMIFAAVGHSAELVPLEEAFFRITCWGAPATVIGSAISGFYAGRGGMKTLMAVQMSGQAFNAVLAYALIFGRLGLPEWGIRGAAWASVIAQALVTVTLMGIFFLPQYRQKYGTWSRRAFDWNLMLRLLRFGVPSGFRFFVEMFAWTGFVFFIGRLGELELAATTIAWRINAIAFFPMIGLSIAVSTLVGQAQGSGRPDWSARCTWRAMGITQVWMTLVACVLIFAPGPLVSLFQSADEMRAVQSADILGIVVVLLRYVAVYTLLDGFNVIFVGALQGAGDTRWTMIASVIMNMMFLLVLWGLDRFVPRLHAEWTAATIAVMVMALVWLWRFRAGQWRSMRVIEASPV